MAWEKRGILTLKYPVESGTIVNWDDAEKLIYECFYNHLRITPEEQPVLFTESPLSSTAQREKLIQIAFETFSVPFFYVIPKQILALIESGYSTGTVMWSGSQSTFVVPVYEGYSLKHSIQKSSQGGIDVSKNLAKLLELRGISLLPHSEDIEDIKKSLCYVASDYNQSCEFYECHLYYSDFVLSKPINTNFGTTEEISIELEKFKCTEPIFNPCVLDAELGRTSTHISHQALFENCISSLLPADIKPTITPNILIGGGNTCLGGYKNRIKKEISSILEKHGIPANSTNFICSDGRSFDYLSGKNFHKMVPYEYWISKETYDEFGPTIVNRYCCN